MVSQAVYVASLLSSTGVALAVGLWLWDEEQSLAGKLFIGIAALETVIGLLVVGELFAPTRSLATAIYGVHSGVAGAIPVLTFLFVVAYIGHRRWLTRRVLAAIMGTWGLFAVVQATNPLHNLVWSEYTVVTSPFAYVEGVPTGLSMVLFLPQSVLYYAAMGLLGVSLVFSSTRRRQTLVLFVAFLPPFFVTSAFFAGALPGPLNGAFVIGSTWTLAVAGWAVFRHELFDLAPVARETVFEVLDEAVVVIDGDRRITDYNRAAVETFPDVGRHQGDPVESVIPELLPGGQRVDAEVEDADGDRSGADGEAAGRGGPALAADAEATDREDPNPDPGSNPDSAVDLVEDVPEAELPIVDSFTRYTGSGPREYSVTVTPLTVREAVEGYALVIRDVTERSQHVRDLEQQTAQLERLASTLSHDLRNPLNVAHGRVQMAREGADTENLDKASDAMKRMEQIIEDSLTLAREGQTIDERERVELAGVARRAWETTDTPGATFEVDPDAEVEIYADPSRLRSVFENLFRNTIDHTAGAPDGDPAADAPGPDADLAEPEHLPGSDGSADAGEALVRGERGDADPGGAGSGSGTRAPGGGDLTVRLGRDGDGFYVEDDGPGVPPEKREEVFDYEFSTAEDGTGLGLAIVQAIARAHGWSVAMTEGSDGGARVVFSGVDVVDGSTAAD